MRFSTRAEYGVRAMLELALHYGKGQLQLKKIAQRQGISERYLERIMTILVSAGFVLSSRGQHGGFVLSKPPNEIQLGQIIEAVEGSMAPIACVDNPKMCKRLETCVVSDIWKKLKKATMDVLNSITLEKMIKMYREKLTTHFFDRGESYD